MPKSNLVLLGSKEMKLSLPVELLKMDFSVYRYNEVSELVNFMENNSKALILLFYSEIPLPLKSFIQFISKSKPDIKFVHLGAEKESLTAWQLRLFHFESTPFSVGKLQLILQYYAQSMNSLVEYFRYSDSEGKHQLALNDIQYLRANGNYTEIRLVGGKKLLISKQLGQIEESLFINANFVRINRSWILNFDKISLLTTDNIYLSPDNHSISLSRDMHRIIKNILSKQGVI